MSEQHIIKLADGRHYNLHNVVSFEPDKNGAIEVQVLLTGGGYVTFFGEDAIAVMRWVKERTIFAPQTWIEK